MKAHRQFDPLVVGSLATGMALTKTSWQELADLASFVLGYKILASEVTDGHTIAPALERLKVLFPKMPDRQSARRANAIELHWEVRRHFPNPVEIVEGEMRRANIDAAT